MPLRLLGRLHARKVSFVEERSLRSFSDPMVVVHLEGRLSCHRARDVVLRYLIMLRQRRSRGWPLDRVPPSRLIALNQFESFDLLCV